MNTTAVPPIVRRHRRGICTVCRREHALNLDGNVRNHYGSKLAWCSGGGQPPTDPCAACCRVLADRERELLEIKGPCSLSRCRLHYAHSGPCDIRAARP